MISGARLSSRTSLVTLIVFYLTFTIASSVFFWFLILDISSGSAGHFRGGVIGVAFVFLAIIIIILSIFWISGILIGIVKQKKTDQLQGGLKLRLIGYFSSFALLVTVPQVVLAIMIVVVTTDKWLPTNTETVIMNSRNSMMDNRDQKIENLRQVSSSRLFNEKLKEMYKNPKQADRIWDDLTEINMLLSAIQLFSQEGETVLFQGNEICRMKYKRVLRETVEGELPQKTIRNNSFFRYLLPVNCADGFSCKAVITQVQAATDNDLINDLTDLSQHYRPLIESRVWMRNNITLVLLLFILIINLISIYISLYLSNQIILPILDIQKATQQVAEGDFSVRLYPDKTNNFGMLASSFNKMVFDLEKLQKNSSHYNKMKAWQDIARRMAHEINNPLTPIRLSAERMLRVYKKKPENFGSVLDKSANAIISEVENLEELLHDFRAFSRLPEPIFERIMLYDLISEVVEIYRHLGDKTISIDLSSLDRSLLLVMDKKQIKQVFSNLVKNSIEALGENGRINISSTLVSRRNIRYCRIILEDNGKGMSEEVLEHIFTPYFTTKQEGTGLGLSIVERIVFSHKGKIRAASKEARGTSFIIDLPMEIQNE